MSALARLAVPFVYGLIFALGCPSQWLLLRLEPAPLTRNEVLGVNAALLLICITYTRTVFVDPGRIPGDWVGKGEGREVQKEGKDGEEEERREKQGDELLRGKSRKWCRKCDAAKPPRAHHCKECGRCIPKMDHHCPWTSNCVSHTTFPHFLRFLLSATLGLLYLDTLLFPRISHLWSTRHLAASLGPSPLQLTHLLTTFLTTTFTLFLLSILLVRNLWSLAVNTTTIESWEQSRHETLLRRARHFGGYLSTPDGSSIRITRQEFPYDIGFLANVCAGMGSANPLSWVNPFAATPPVATGLAFETNGFEDPGTSWPPPDPDRAYRRRGGGEQGPAFTYRDQGLGAEETVRAFRARQAEDAVRRRKPFVQRMEAVREREREGYGGGYGGYDGVGVESEEEEGNDYEGSEEGRQYGEGGEGEEGWRNSEGERLKDFGLDEDVEFYDEQEDEIPLSELLARRQAQAQAQTQTTSGGWAASGSTY